MNGVRCREATPTDLADGGPPFCALPPAASVQRNTAVLSSTGRQQAHLLVARGQATGGELQRYMPADLSLKAAFGTSARLFGCEKRPCIGRRPASDSTFAYTLLNEIDLNKIPRLLHWTELQLLDTTRCRPLVRRPFVDTRQSFCGYTTLAHQLEDPGIVQSVQGRVQEAERRGRGPVRKTGRESSRALRISAARLPQKVWRRAASSITTQKTPPFAWKQTWCRHIRDDE